VLLHAYQHQTDSEGTLPKGSVDVNVAIT
jgi:hypothetical protein